MIVTPTFEVETGLFAAGDRVLIGCDEVGRGAIAGPVAVGMTVVDALVGPFPEGLRDSKLLSRKRREELAPLCGAWVRSHAVGMAGPDEVDGLGIVAALGLAGRRALVALHEAGVDILGSRVLLDGSHDWLTPALGAPPAVTTRVKGDRDCAAVAAASVIAKVHRDALMAEHHTRYPAYGWDRNMGYGSAEHRAAIAEVGPSPLHRMTWLHGALEPTGSVEPLGSATSASPA